MSLHGTFSLDQSVTLRHSIHESVSLHRISSSDHNDTTQHFPLVSDRIHKALIRMIITILYTCFVLFYFFLFCVYFEVDIKFYTFWKQQILEN